MCTKKRSCYRRATRRPASASGQSSFEFSGVCVLVWIFRPFVSSSGLTDAFKVLPETVPDASDIPDEPPALGAWMMARNFAELTIEAYGGGLWGLFTVSDVLLAVPTFSLRPSCRGPSSRCPAAPTCEGIMWLHSALRRTCSR